MFRYASQSNLPNQSPSIREAYGNLEEAAWLLIGIGQKPSRVVGLHNVRDELAKAVSRPRLWSDDSIRSVLRAVSGGDGILRNFDIRRRTGYSSLGVVRGEPASRLRASYQRFLHASRKVKATDPRGNIACASRFLCIHPFADGNGRTARVLLAASLAHGAGSALLAAEIVSKLFVDRLPMFIDAAESLQLTGDDSKLADLLNEFLPTASSNLRQLSICPPST